MPLRSPRRCATSGASRARGLEARGARRRRLRADAAPAVLESAALRLHQHPRLAPAALARRRARRSARSSRAMPRRASASCRWMRDSTPGRARSRRRVAIAARDTARLAGATSSRCSAPARSSRRSRDSPPARSRATPSRREGVTYAAKIEKSEARIDWSRERREIERQVRAFDPWPIAETRARRASQLRILAGHALEEPPDERMLIGTDDKSTSSGTIIAVRDDFIAGSVRPGAARRHAGAAPGRARRQRARILAQPRRSRAGALARTPWAPGAPPLAGAARGRRGRGAGRALGRCGARGAEATRARRVRAIALGTLRWYLRLAPALEPLLEPAAPASPPPVRALLVAGAHQVEYSRNAPEATVHAAVDAARILGSRARRGLVNAVLRRFVAERAGSPVSAWTQRSRGRTAHPAWLVERLARGMAREAPSHARRQQCASAAGAARGPRPRGRGRATCAARRPRLLAQTRYSGSLSVPDLDHPVGVSRAAGFRRGRGLGAGCGRAARGALLDAGPGHARARCLRGPGRQDRAPARAGSRRAASVTARRHRRRARRARSARTSRRLRRAATRRGRRCARSRQSFWDGRPFERILVDAPCSSTGVIRRHPDIKLLRRAQRHRRLRAPASWRCCAAALRLLAPGGRLLYCTCSVLPEENERSLQRFLGDEPHVRRGGDAARRRARARGGRRTLGVQLLPGAEAGTDGFYYACLEKTTAGP